jgi:N-terminal domain of toast_rack, DUF2154
MIIRFTLLVAAALCLTACSIDMAPSGPPQHESKSVDLDKSEIVKVDLRMGAGEMKVDGGAQKLLVADFTYSAAKPDVRYNSTGVRGYLTVEQTGHNKISGNNTYRWDLKFNNDVPIDFQVHFGAGQARLNLGSLSLRSVDVEMGVGQIDMDLRGQPKRDYDVHVRGGVGEATIYLPRDVGIYADATGGIGGIKTRGLRQEGNHYVSEGYEKAKVKVRLDVRGGVGAINLYAE